MPHIPEENAYYPERSSLFELSDRHPHGIVDVLFIGDSLFHRALWNEFLPGLNVLNRGIGSDSTQGILQRLPKYRDYKPRNIVILAGLNDFAYKFTMDESMANYEGILKAFRDDFSEANPVVISLLPNADGKFEAECLEFNRRLEKMCRAFSMKFVDAWSPFKAHMRDEASTRELFAPDGLHLAGKGYQILMDSFLDKLS